MGEAYIGKLMRVFFHNEAEAIGTLDKVMGETQQLTFTSIRWEKGPGGLTTNVDPTKIEPVATFANTVNAAPPPQQHAYAAQVPQHQQAPHAYGQNDWVPPPPVPQQAAPQQPAQKSNPWGTPPRQPLAPQNHQTAPQQPQAPAVAEPSAEARRAPVAAWGRGRQGRAPQQPPARYAQPAPTAAATSTPAPAPAAAPTTWANAVGGPVAGRRPGGGRGGGRGGGPARSGPGRRAWTPGIPQGDAQATAVTDDFDFAANNVAFEAEKPNLLAEMGMDGGAEGGTDVPPAARKPEFEDNFFDMISHTVHEKIGMAPPVPRPGIKEQRELNMETFGAATVPRAAHPRGPGGRFYGAGGAGGASAAQGGRGRGPPGGRAPAGRGGGGRGQGYGGRGDGRGRAGEGGGGGRGRGWGGGGGWGRGAVGSGRAGQNGRGGGRGAVRGGGRGTDK